jgi:hypothetical protein
MVRHLGETPLIVTKQEELEAALAKAEAERERLEATLAKAKAALVNTVTNAARIDVDRAEANAKVDQARAYCRQLRAALSELNRSGPKSRSHASIGGPTKQIEEVSKQAAASILPSGLSREPAVHELRSGLADEFGRPTPKRRFNAVPARSILLRQTIGLLALTLAYLQYYYFDVQLQIVNLPSILALPLQ